MKDAIDRLTDGLDETQRQALGDLSALAYLFDPTLCPTRVRKTLRACWRR